MDVVRAGGYERAAPFLPPLLSQLSQSKPDIPTAGIHQYSPAGFRIGHFDPAGFRELILSGIVDRDRDDFVSAAEPAERALPALGNEVGKHHHDAAMT